MKKASVFFLSLFISIANFSNMKIFAQANSNLHDFAKKNSSARDLTKANSLSFARRDEFAKSAFLKGANLFREGDWKSAMISLRNAISFPENNTAETRYLLIASEMYAAAYEEASLDCNYFLRQFPDSEYVPFVQYQKGRASYFLGEYENAIVLLSDFCHQFLESDLYPSALFWIAESFYANCSYADALPLYERIANEFPNDEKAVDARVRMETIKQKKREEKLLYLLKQTGEAYLSAKEGMEKQQLVNDTEAKVSTNTTKRADELAQSNAALQKEIDALHSHIADLESNIQSFTETEKAKRNEQIARLKIQAKIVEEMLDGGTK